MNKRKNNLKDGKKSEVRSPKSESHEITEIKNKSDRDSYRDEHPKRHSPLEHLKKINKSKISEIQNMEVHHHPEVEKKSFKEYLLEGLMIFLAVFMGFIAENIREHIADNEREQQYMESLVRDLALDAAALKAGFPLKEKRIEAIDTVFLFFQSNIKPKTIPLNIYRNVRRATYDRVYTRNTGTINQLKNAGGLRLIRQPDVRDSLATYDWFWDRLSYYKDVYYTDQQIEYGVIEKMLNANDLILSYRLNNSGKSIYPSLSNSSIIGIDNSYLNEYLNLMSRQKITTIQDEERYKILEDKAELLIKMIKKEYNLE
jgi:hypothetical protein